jgi:hypothetical protein
MFDQEREDAMNRGEDARDKAKCPECRVHPLLISLTAG